MTDMLVRSSTFDFPAPVRPVGTLLGVANVQDSSGWLGEPQGLVESYNCMILDSIPIWPCPAPAPVAAPVLGVSATATTGGTLAAGTYRAKITLVNGNGETVASNEVSQVTTGAASTVTWNYPAAPAGSSYRIYITNGAINSETYVGPALGTSFVLSAPPATGGAVPPAVNTALATTTKTFDKPSWQDGIRFGVYGGVTCKGAGYDIATMREKALASFLALESVGVERALMTMRFIAGTWGAAPVDVTPVGGAVLPSVGLGLLEGNASCNYAGVPVIHSSRLMGSMLIGFYQSIVREGDSLFTKLGAPLVAGGGYGCPNTGPTGAPPAAGEEWMYASGGVNIVRSEVIVASDIDRATNDVYVLVERAYIAVVDCYTSAVRVKVA